ncbi:MAG: phage protein Gp36 family protein [Bacteroidales bacterium]
MRFITEPDYDMQIKREIMRLLTSPDDWYVSAKLVRAEQTATDQIRNRIGKRYDCDLIFIEAGEPDQRDQWIVTITIDIALYHLYSQTGSKDIPQHRQDRYQDAIDWLKDVGNGNTSANLPEIVDEDGEAVSDVRLWGRELNNHKY